MIFDTEINNTIYTIEGDLESPYVDIESITYNHETLPEVKEIPKQFIHDFYTRNKDIIDQDAMAQAKWNEHHKTETKRGIYV